MKKIFTISIFFLVLLSINIFASDDLVVMSVKGKVEVKKGGKGKFALLTVGMSLKGEDVVKTSFASYAKIMYKQRQLLSIDENTMTKINTLVKGVSPEGSDKASPAGKIMSYLADKLTKTQTKTENQNVFGAVRGSDEVFNALYPRKGSIRTTRPIFEWLNTGDKSKYTFTLLDENLSPVFETQLDSTKLVYLQSHPKLQDGKRYMWRVVRMSDGAESDIVPFTILQKDTIALVDQEVASLSEELRKMNADEIIMHVIKGTYYEQRDLLYDAFLEMRDAVKLAPSVKDYREMANYLLLRMGLYNEQSFLLK